MNKLSYAAAVACLSLTALAGSARAQTTVVATASNINASGTYHVTATTSDFVNWAYTVVGDNNGNAQMADANFVRFIFGSPTDVALEVDGATNNLGWTNTFFPTTPDRVDFNKGASPTFLLHDGSNSLSGTVTLNAAQVAAEHGVATFELLVEGTKGAKGSQWDGVNTVVPEPASALLLVPGLLPLGLVARRRRSSRSK